MNFINLENKINNVVKINKNFSQLFKREKYYQNLILNYKDIMETISLNKTSFDRVNEFLNISEDPILYDVVKFLIFRKYKNNLNPEFIG